MENTTETTSTAVATSKHFQSWLWGLRLSAAGAMAMFLLYLCQRFLWAAGLSPCDPERQYAGLPLRFLPALLPYLLILWRVRTVSPTAAGRIKRGLALAIPWGLVVLIPSLFFVETENLTEESEWVSWVLLTWALIQTMLVASAIGTYYTMGREPKDRRTLGGGIFGALVYFVIVLVVTAASLPGLTPSLSQSQWTRNQASAEGSVRTINTAQITYAYASTYNRGYAPKLEWLGPAEEGSSPTPELAGLIDDVLATGEKSGYLFNFTPDPPDEEGKITSYGLTARPLTYKRTGCRSYFTDETGVIRATEKDRLATADDPPVGG